MIAYRTEDVCLAMGQTVTGLPHFHLVNDKLIELVYRLSTSLVKYIQYTSNKYYSTTNLGINNTLNYYINIYIKYMQIRVYI